MIQMHPKGMMFLGIGLMIFGVAAPFLMIIKVLETSFWLSFLSYAASIVGMVLGFLGLFMYTKIDRH